MNPGYWKIQSRALRRRLKNVGDGNPVLWFPWHWETHRRDEIPLNRDLSLPYGMIWRRDWKMQGNYTIQIEVEIKALPPSLRETIDWRQHQAGYALAGICFGSDSLHESWSAAGNEADLQLYQYQDRAEKTCWFAAWRDNGTFGLYDHASDVPEPLDKHLEVAVSKPEVGDRVTIQLEVSGGESEPAQVMATFFRHAEKTQVLIRNVEREKFTDGYVGLVSRGLLDFEVKEVILHPGKTKACSYPSTNCMSVIRWLIRFDRKTASGNANSWRSSAMKGNRPKSKLPRLHCLEQAGLNWGRQGRLRSSPTTSVAIQP